MALVALPLITGLATRVDSPVLAPFGAAPGALRASLASAGPGDEVAGFYRAREFRPLWAEGAALRPEAREAVAMLAAADRDGLSAEPYQPQRLRVLIEAAKSGRARAVAQADLALSRAFAAYAVDLRQAPPEARMIVTDPALRRPIVTPRAALEAAARAPSLHAHLTTLRRMGPTYEALRRGLADYRVQWSALPRTPVPEGPVLALGDAGPRVEALRMRLGLAGAGGRFDAALRSAVQRFQAAHGLAVTGRVDARTVSALNAGPQAYERLILANLARARDLPADPGRRYILVDAAAARLDVYEDGQVQDTMPVVVGKVSQPTPLMAGMIRYVVFNPYWNIPEDLVRDKVAPRVLREGAASLEGRQMEALSGWSPAARVLRPEEVDWAAVAAGRRYLRVRQRPGPENMMGAVKLMLPNSLGIYLHDTPDKSVFAGADRRISSGCVRLAHAPRLTRRLLGPAGLDEWPANPDKRVDLPEPVPVYITYFTVAPSAGGVVFREDPYRRDPPLLAAMARRQGRAA